MTNTIQRPMTNVERAEIFQDALHTYTLDSRNEQRTTEHSTAYPNETPAQVARLLADLFHFGELAGVDVDACIELARARWIDEKQRPALYAQPDSLTKS